jgi:hypothetical protein
VRPLRITIAVIVFIAIGVEFHDKAAGSSFDAGHFFSFFTIVCNVFGALVLLATATGYPRNEHRRDVLRGAATLCLTIVGVVFSILLAGLESAMLVWTNAVVHYVMPVAIVLDWCIDPPRTRLTFRDVLWWLALPVVYIAYTLIRGPIVKWYPYPFFDVAKIGYGAVSAYLVAIAVFALVVSGALAEIANRRAARR